MIDKANFSNEERVMLEKYLREVKQQMKTHSKNELIRMIGALLVDNAALKSMVESMQTAAKTTVNEESE